MDVFYWIAVAIIAIGSAARLTRLVVHDDFPPMRWFRDWVLDKFEPSPWTLLVICPFCVSFWITLVIFGLAPSVVENYGEPWSILWWWVNGSLAASYVVGEVVFRDVNRGGKN
jgi:hypothetical protein